MSPPDPDLDPVHILLVDDRPNNLLSLKGLLQRPDYNLVLAGSGEEALAQVLRQDFAVILMDVAMPVMDGLQTASIIKEREQSKRIPIIFITASVYDMEHIFRGYTVGAVDYLRKPLDPQAVRGKVEVFVELYRQRKQIERQAARLREAELREQVLLRTRAERALRESESTYQSTFDAAPVGIGHADPDGRIRRANQRLCQILDYDHGDLIGRRMEELVLDADARAISERLERLRGGDALYAGEHQLRRRTGEAIWAQVTLSALHDPAQGRATRFIIVVEDISARKQLELVRSRVLRDLQHGIRTRDDFISIVAHELKTPVTPVRLQLASLLREAEKGKAIPPGDLVRRLGSADRAARRLEELIDRLLDVSRLNVGAVTLHLEDVDLAAVARDVVGRLGRDAEQSGSTIALIAERPVPGRWDRLRIEQVITNLVVNAIKYGGGKPIEVSVTQDADEARLQVRDQGEGISADDQERIFERFERVAPLRHQSGFGLGLWIVRQILDAHGGRIAVSSEPGRGSAFTVDLPLEAERRPGPALEPTRGQAPP